jgi:hypothetical protein
MPFDPGFDDVYKLGIKPACQKAGAYCERVDEQIFTESILDRVYNQIAKADLIVADVTGRNPNVFYEVGYAHALGQRVILLTRQADDIPFDLKVYPHIIYEGRIAHLKAQLGRKVRRLLSQPRTALVDLSTALHFYVDDQRIVDGAQIRLREDQYRGTTDRIAWPLNLHLHNPTDRLIDATGFSVGFLLPAGSSQGGSALREIVLPDKRCLLFCFDLGMILTEEWKLQPIWVETDNPGHVWPPPAVPCVLRIFTPTGTSDIHFQAVFESSTSLASEQTVP